VLSQAPVSRAFPPGREAPNPSTYLVYLVHLAYLPARLPALPPHLPVCCGHARTGFTGCPFTIFTMWFRILDVPAGAMLGCPTSSVYGDLHDSGEGN